MNDSEPFDRAAFLASWPREFTEAEWAAIERFPIHDEGTRPPPDTVLIEDRHGNVRVVQVPKEFRGLIGYGGGDESH